MATAAPAQELFYCHECTAEIVPELPDFLCPTCHQGFIEALTQEAPQPGSSSRLRRAASVPAPAPPSPPHPAPHPPHTYFNWLLGGVPSPDDALDPLDSLDQPQPHAHRHGAPRLLTQLPRRTRLRGASRTATLGPMLQELILSFSTTGLPTQLTGQLAGHPDDYVWGGRNFDAVITHLMGQMDAQGPPPLTEGQIGDIPCVQVSQEQVDNASQCSVCMDEFTLGESVKRLPCEHCFHAACIAPWLSMHATCPVCRKPLQPPAPDEPPSASGGAPASSFLFLEDDDVD